MDDNTEATPAPEEQVPEAPADDSPEAGLEALRRELEEARAAQARAETERDHLAQQRQAEAAARVEAERRAQSATNDAGQMRLSAVEAQYDAVLNALAATKGQLAVSQKALETAMTEGNFAEAGKLSADIGRLAAKESELENGKTQIEQYRRQPQQQPQQQQPQPQPRNQRDELLNSRSAQSAAWLRTVDNGVARVDRFLSDEGFRRRVVGADELARGRGIQPDTDAYFAFINEQVGIAPPQEQQQPVQQQPASPTSAAGRTAQRQPTPAAPPAGSTSTAQRPGNNSGEIRLTAEQRDFCKLNGISEVGYAKQLKQLQDEGVIARA